MSSSICHLSYLRIAACALCRHPTGYYAVDDQTHDHDESSDGTNSSWDESENEDDADNADSDDPESCTQLDATENGEAELHVPHNQVYYRPTWPA